MRVVILRMPQLQVLDATGAQALGELIAELEGRGITVLIKGPRAEHVRVLRAVGALDHLRHERHLFGPWRTPWPTLGARGATTRAARAGHDRPQRSLIAARGRRATARVRAAGRLRGRRGLPDGRLPGVLADDRGAARLLPVARHLGPVTARRHAHHLRLP